MSLDDVIALGKVVIEWGAYTITVAAGAMALLPQGEPGSKLDRARTWLNKLALNVKNAKNVTLKKERPV